MFTVSTIMTMFILNSVDLVYFGRVGSGQLSSLRECDLFNFASCSVDATKIAKEVGTQTATFPLHIIHLPELKNPALGKLPSCSISKEKTKREAYLRMFFL